MHPVAQFDGGSFRDPSGRVFHENGRVYRAIYGQGTEAYRRALEGGFLQELIDEGWLIEAQPASRGGGIGCASDAELILEHPKLDFVSYPYEWCFSELKAAALHHLNFHIRLLAAGYTLSDATAYNIQFRGTKPVFIDHLSIISYDEGEAWIGQRQFGMQFLNPLFLWSQKNVAPVAWMRGSLEGIEPEELLELLSIRDKLSFTVLAHIVGPAYYARRRIENADYQEKKNKVRLSKSKLVALLTSLRDYISELRPPGAKTVWDDYATNNSYSKLGTETKSVFISNWISKFQPNQVFDLGCNSGDFCMSAIEGGAKSVVGFDFDFGALERAYHRFDDLNLNVLPLWLDATNPSPSQGWAEAERKGLNERASADALLALALIHHLCISKNIPLDLAIPWLVDLAPAGIIEFPSKSDPMVGALLRNREDIFPNFTEEVFLSELKKSSTILETKRLEDTGRLLVAYERRS